MEIRERKQIIMKRETLERPNEFIYNHRALMITEDNPFGIVANRYYVYDWGQIYDTISGKFVPMYTDKDGYLRGEMVTVNGRKALFQHRVIAMMYCPNPYNDYSPEIQVNHKDGIKYHNWYSNLEWCTNQENQMHALNTHLRETKYSEELVSKICEKLEYNQKNNIPYMYRDILIQLNVEPTPELEALVANIKNGRRWNRLSDNYDIKSGRNNIYSGELVLKIAYLLEDGKTPKEIIDELGLEYDIPTRGLIGAIKYKQAYCDLTKGIDTTGKRHDEKEEKEKIGHKICKLLEEGKNYAQIIKELDLEDTKKVRDNLANIKTGRRYKHISSQYNISDKKFLPAKLTEDTVRKICEELEKVLTYEKRKYDSHEIVQKVGLEDTVQNRNMVHNIKGRRNWNNISKDYKW